MCLQVLQEAAPSRDRNQGLKPPPQGFEPTGQSVTLHRKTIEEGVDCSEGRARVLVELSLDAGSPPPHWILSASGGPVDSAATTLASCLFHAECPAQCSPFSALV